MLHNSLNAIENIHNVISKPALLLGHHAVFSSPESVSGFTQDVFVSFSFVLQLY